MQGKWARANAMARIGTGYLGLAFVAVLPLVGAAAGCGHPRLAVGLRRRIELARLHRVPGKRWRRGAHRHRSGHQMRI